MNDSEYLPLSMLSQVEYCPRRAALLMNERIWEENVDTAKGRMEHARVHTARTERRGNSIKLYEYTVFSDKLGVWGKCDCIEAQRNEAGCRIKACDFPVSLYPVEFKHGFVRKEMPYMIQLCAQAMCLESMLGAVVPRGALFFITAHRRLEIEFTAELRGAVSSRARLLHSLCDEQCVPPAEYSAKCSRCSIREYCMPKAKKTALEYCRRLEQEAREVQRW